ncbi:transmembrane protein 256 homolog isoform X1 [Drosophila elegans]|uniref:transmembrane protein 256 homolog isoform X1 n=2 Tax=Drosophila elegans TaxID=30023 RepID=UPI0007E5D590|nr:transmembrane protein 256 homolog isoform X1 [Drosophila elegans]
MSLAEALDYLIVSNPVSETILSTVMAFLDSIGWHMRKMPLEESYLVLHPSSHHYVRSHSSLYCLAGCHYHFVRLAGIGGASAIFMGAYCKYVLRDLDDVRDQLDSQAYADVANRIHFLHSFAMMAMPLAHYPLLTGTLMITGTLCFSGSMYYRALTGEQWMQPYATMGGFCLMAAWLSLIL